LITITRHQARQLRTALRRALSRSGRNHLAVPIELHAGPEGQRVRARSDVAAVEYHESGERDADQLALPAAFLNDCEGRRHDPVRIERSADDNVIVQRTDGSVPQVVTYDASDANGEFPRPPEHLAENDPSLLNALAEAMNTTDSESTRYAINCVQLRGSTGVMAATDARQLLLENGFRFRWDDDLLVQHTSLFAARELPRDQSVFVGRTDDWFYVRVGPWSFYLAVMKEGRFPHVDDHIASVESAAATMKITDTDAGFLSESLKSLPCPDEHTRPVTVDLNGSVAIRARANDQQPPVEVLLTSSKRTGEQLRINTNRTYLARALSLGFRDVHIFRPESPVLCQDAHRTYVWALLTPEDAFQPSADAIRIESTAKATPDSVNPPRQLKEKTVVNRQQDSSNNNSTSPVPSSTEELIAAAEQLKASLRDTLGKTSELIAGLKRQRKEARIVRSTLESLRQLQDVG